jgi:hypothetical protein
MSNINTPKKQLYCKLNLDFGLRPSYYSGTRETEFFQLFQGVWLGKETGVKGAPETPRGGRMVGRRWVLSGYG